MRRVRIEGDLYHQRVPSGAVKVTRPGRWGNPYKVADYGLTRALELYRQHLADHPERVERARRELAGKDLACWCPLDQPCHADILMEAMGESR
jgi:hypothetical protein